MLYRVRALLAALWGGLLLGVAGITMPSAFAILERAQAGKLAGRVFELDAAIGLMLALVLVMIERRLQRDAETTSAMTAELLLPLAAMFLTVLGFYALQPMMELARAGQGGLSFGALHGISTALFALKGLAVLTLAWRVTKNSPAVGSTVSPAGTTS